MLKMGSKIAFCTMLSGLLLLSACGESAAPESNATETVLGDIDVLEGSASDEMITVDEFDNVPNPAPNADGATGPNKPADAATEDAPAADAPAANKGANAGDTVIRPRIAPPAPGPVTPDIPDDADTGV